LGSRLSKRHVALAVLLVAGGLAAHGSAAPSADVTLSVSTYKNANGVTATLFTGAVASAAPGQIVEIEGRDCGGQGFRSISSARTRPGGGFEADNPEREFPFRYSQWDSGMTFRARWNGQLSNLFVLRLPAPLNVTKVKGKKRAWRVHVTPPMPGTVSMKGKVVQLQRLRDRTWKTIARRPLIYKPRLVFNGSFNHEVVFQIPRRGWQLRAILPAKHAAPCYATGTSPQWRS
jgi:hypothetical protein